ncbi:hypothetical protein Tco_0524661 [Tanacetum coccineum]
MSIQDMELQKQQHLEEMQSISNQIQIKDYRNERIDDEVIKSSVEDLVPIPSESKDTSDNDSESDLPFCDNSVTFSNSLFNDNYNFTSSDDESLPEEDVPKENFKIYSNPLFEFDDEYIFSDVNPLSNEVLEDIESEDSYVSKHDDPDLLVTPLSKLNKDGCFDPGGDFVLEEIEACLTSDSIPPWRVMIGAKTWKGSKAMMMDLESRDEIETYETLLKA